MTIVTDQENRAERRRAAREAAQQTATGGQAAAAAIDKAFAPTPAVAKPLPTAAGLGGATLEPTEAAKLPAPGEKPLPTAAVHFPVSETIDQPRPGQKPLPAILGEVGKDRSPANRKLSKKAAQAEQRRATEAQAREDSLRMPEPAPDNYKPGDTIPLHILNQRARQYEEEARNEANELGKAVGKFVEDQVTTRTPRAVMRSKKARDAQDAMARAQAKKSG